MVNVNNDISHLHEIFFGVPQGSALGPTLYLTAVCRTSNPDFVLFSETGLLSPFQIVWIPAFYIVIQVYNITFSCILLIIWLLSLKSKISLRTNQNIFLVFGKNMFDVLLQFSINIWSVIHAIFNFRILKLKK